MALTPASVTRLKDPAGDSIKTFQDSVGTEIQAMALVDENGSHIAGSANPIYVVSSTSNPSAVTIGTTVLAGFIDFHFH